MAQGLKPVVLRSFNGWLPGIVTLERITASAHAAFNLPELGAYLTLPRRQAVRQARHLAGPGHGAGYLNGFTYFHFLLCLTESELIPLWLIDPGPVLTLLFLS